MAGPNQEYSQHTGTSYWYLPASQFSIEPRPGANLKQQQQQQQRRRNERRKAITTSPVVREKKKKASRFSAMQFSLPAASPATRLLGVVN